jgi:hypothetical protein
VSLRALLAPEKPSAYAPLKSSDFAFMDQVSLINFTIFLLLLTSFYFFSVKILDFDDGNFASHLLKNSFFSCISESCQKATKLINRLERLVYAGTFHLLFQ